MADAYFTVEEFRARYANDSGVTDLEDEQIDEHRATAEEIIEGLDDETNDGGCHQAFVLRSESFDVWGSSRIEIPRYRVRSIESLTIEGDSQDIQGLWLDGRAILGGGWDGPLSVTVTHGWDAPPRRIKEAAMILTYQRAITGPIDDRAIGRVTPEGSILNLATPGMRGAVTGIPEVDAAIRQFRKKRIRPTSVWAGEPDATPPGPAGWREGVWP